MGNEGGADWGWGHALMEGRLFMGPWGRRLPSEAVSVLHDLPAGSQQHGGAEGGGHAAEPRPALPRVHLPHHGDSAWTSLGASPGWKVMGSLPCLPGLSWVGAGKGPWREADPPWLLSAALWARVPPRASLTLRDRSAASLAPAPAPPLGCLHQAGACCLAVMVRPGRAWLHVGTFFFVIGEWGGQGPQPSLVPFYLSVTATLPGLIGEGLPSPH